MASTPGGREDPHVNNEWYDVRACVQSYHIGLDTKDCNGHDYQCFGVDMPP